MPSCHVPDKQRVVKYLPHIPSSLHPDSGSQIQLSRDKVNNEEGSPQGRNRSLTFLCPQPSGLHRSLRRAAVVSISRALGPTPTSEKSQDSM